VTCPCCRRDNHPARRYCGGCGCNFAPACEACGFANEQPDRFCGGCGAPLSAAALPVVSGVAPQVHVAQAQAAQATTAAARWQPSELAELFAFPSAVPEGPRLPETGAVAQDDLDRLFGGAS
jgi:hypothetical protein